MTTSRNALASALGLSTVDNDVAVLGVSPLSAPIAHTLTFVKVWTSEADATVRRHQETVFLVPHNAASESLPDNALVVEAPRRAYAKLVRDHFAEKATIGVHPTAVIADDVVLGEGVSIGAYTVIERQCAIGDHTMIDSHCLVKARTVVGSRCRIGSHTSIGGAGFGYEMDMDGTPIHIPHLGDVRIGSHVEIGSHVTLARGTVGSTQIDDHVKIDDAVFVAHNVQIGESSFIIAGAEVSGSVVIGRGVWVSPEASIINQVTVGDNALVGIGAVVVKDVAPNTVVAGVPAKERGLRYDRAAESS